MIVCILVCKVCMYSMYVFLYVCVDVCPFVCVGKRIGENLIEVYHGNLEFKQYD